MFTVRTCEFTWKLKIELCLANLFWTWSFILQVFVICLDGFTNTKERTSMKMSGIRVVCWGSPKVVRWLLLHEGLFIFVHWFFLSFCKMELYYKFNMLSLIDFYKRSDALTSNTIFVCKVTCMKVVFFYLIDLFSFWDLGSNASLLQLRLTQGCVQTLYSL